MFPRRRASKALRPCAHEPDDLQRGAGGHKRRRDVPASLLDRAGHADAENRASSACRSSSVVLRAWTINRSILACSRWDDANMVQSTDRSTWATLSIRARTLSGFVVPTVWRSAKPSSRRTGSIAALNVPIRNRPVPQPLRDTHQYRVRHRSIERMLRAERLSAERLVDERHGRFQHAVQSGLVIALQMPVLVHESVQEQLHRPLVRIELVEQRKEPQQQLTVLLSCALFPEGIGLPGARGRFHQCHRGEMERTFGEVTA